MSSSIDEAINAGLILVVTVFMSYVTWVVGDLFSFGYWQNSSNTSQTVDTEPDNTSGDWEYVEGTGDQIVDILPVVVLLVGLLASFLKLRDIANTSSGFRR